MGTEGGPSASDIVYLFGDRFVNKARMGGEQLVYGGAKVKHSDLAEKLLVAAFADLAGRGYLGLEAIQEKKLGLFTTRDVQITRLSGAGEALYGVDAAIWDNLSGDPRQDRVREIISRILGGECPNPWRNIVELAKKGLAEQGYLLVEKEELRFRPDKLHWSADEGQILAREGQVDEVRATLSSLEARDPALYKQLVDSVKKGIRAMLESPDFDSD
jgi:hypothetical protein